MRAARYYGKEEIHIKDDVPRPKVGDGQVKVEPAFVGICGTDLHEYLGGPKYVLPPRYAPRPIKADGRDAASPLQALIPLRGRRFP